MKANELRIGNFISDSDEGFAAMLSSFMGTLNTPHCKVSSLGREGCEVECLECEDNIGCAIPYLEIEPIPITKDWLLKLGFETMNYERNLCNYTIDCTPKNYKYKYALQTNIGSCDSALLPIRWTPMERSGDSHSFPCEYVHQLQNLYFTLTGEELTIKD